MLRYNQNIYLEMAKIQLYRLWNRSQSFSHSSALRYSKVKSIPYTMLLFCFNNEVRIPVPQAISKTSDPLGTLFN